MHKLFLVNIQLLFMFVFAGILALGFKQFGSEEKLSLDALGHLFEVLLYKFIIIYQLKY